MANMFAIEPDTGATSPFNSNEPSEWGEGEELPPIPVGVLRGHIVKAEKARNGKNVLTVKCDDPNYAASEEIALWPEAVDLLQLAGALGVMTRQENNQVFYRDSDGHTGLKAFEGKAGLFIFAPYKKDGIETPSIGRFGLPAMTSSDLWAAYWEQSGFDDKQTNALKKSRGGAVPPIYHELFTE